MTHQPCHRCGEPCLTGLDRPTSAEFYAAMPYCRVCFDTGQAHTAINEPILAPLRAAGFPAEVWQTGGHCMNYAVALTEAGWDGPHALLGFALNDLADPEECANTELGVSLMVHPDDGDLLWVDEIGNAATCPACQALYALEEEMNNTVPATPRPEDISDWLLATARRLARAVHVHQNHTTPVPA